ncbi:MAG: hypothetical protein HKN42_05755, partial [Granulosicoccus sp.]|nr:hypothetical protein [Granulosicoccus sp.]
MHIGGVNSMRLLVFFIGCLIGLSGCGSSGNSVMEPVHESGLLHDQSILVGNEIRSYHLYLPENPSTAPIVFLLHGNGGSSDQLLGVSGSKAPYKVWMDVALRENIILVVPDGTLGSNGKKGWNDCRVDASRNPDSDDVHFIGKLSNRIESNYSAGKPAVYAMGTSNGGMMVQRLADELPESLKGIAMVVAARPVNSQCATSSVPLSVLVMYGTS